MYCNKCGTSNPEEANFCRSCGASLQVHFQKENPSIPKRRFLSGMVLFIVEAIFIGLCLGASRDMHPDSDGVILNAFYFLLSCVIYLVLSWMKKTISIKSPNFHLSIFLILFVINTFLLPMWNGSLVSSYLILSIGLAVNSVWAWIKR